MIWLLAIFIVVVLLVAALSRPPKEQKPDLVADTRAQVGLHRACRRLEVAQLKNEVKREAAQTQRELREELESIL